MAEVHPDSPHADLRLDCPFSELDGMIFSCSRCAHVQRSLTSLHSLAVFCDTLDLENLPDDKHRHVPYALVLLHYIRKWRAAVWTCCPLRPNWLLRDYTT